MNGISFRLSGKTACFRKPDVNQFAYFTYNNIHKVALLGLLGAILGYGGYTQLFDKNRGLKPKDKNYDNGYPEFYEKLQEFKVSIIPIAPHGYFSKKIQVFNNSVGYASREEGGNLIVREQWLENPSWQIIVLNNGSSEYKKLKEYLIDKKSVFIPYLGKNDHPANIDNVMEIELNEKIENIRLSSLFIENSCEIYNGKPRGELSYIFREVSPIILQKEFHFYEYKNLIFTNHKVVSIEYKDIYSNDNKNYFFI